MKTRTEYVEIEYAGHISGYKVRLAFNDGTERIMDFGHYLRNAQNPNLMKYRSSRLFKEFHLHYGNLMWGDYEMVFRIADLYGVEI